MKRFVLITGLSLVLSAAVTVAYKAYTRSQMTDFMKANLEALTQNENGSLGIDVMCDLSHYTPCAVTCPRCGTIHTNSRFENYKLDVANGRCQSCGLEIYVDL